MKRTHHRHNNHEKEVLVEQPNDTAIDVDYQQVIVDKSEEDTKRIIRTGFKTRRAKAVKDHSK